MMHHQKSRPIISAPFLSSASTYLCVPFLPWVIHTIACWSHLQPNHARVTSHECLPLLCLPTILFEKPAADVFFLFSRRELSLDALGVACSLVGPVLFTSLGCHVRVISHSHSLQDLTALEMREPTLLTNRYALFFFCIPPQATWFTLLQSFPACIFQQNKCDSQQ